MGQIVWVGMSGGVDSSVAALLLQRQGFTVVGVTMRLRGGRLAQQTGTQAETDIIDARAVCEKLGIPHRVLDLTDAFCRCVVDEFAAEYAAGRTPNPLKVALPTFPAPSCVPSVGVRIFTTHFPHKKEGASYLLPKVPGTIMKKCYQK